jgi:imidazolonepropionase-like amidohydrolase
MRQLLAAVVLVAVSAMQAPAPAPNFRLYFLGHEIGREIVTWTNSGRHFDSDFHFEDRGTAIDLTASFDSDDKGRPSRLVVKGRNYRLFSTDSEVTIAGDRAHVRDFKAERDIELRRKDFFPIDNYAPIAVQAALIRYWQSHGRPREIAAAPSGPVIRITSRGMEALEGPTDLPPRRTALSVERLAIGGVAWGTQTAWVTVPDRGGVVGSLVALTTWAGALPFQAVARGWEGQLDRLMRRAAQDRVDDLRRQMRDVAPVATGAFAIVNARVVQGTATPAIENGTIVIRDGRVVAVGPAATTPVPAGMKRVDASGTTVIPGLWDMHAHASQVDWAPVYLASGVTTVRDLGGDNAFLVEIRNAIRSGSVAGPRYLLSGLVDGPGPPDEGRAVVRKYHADGFEQMKIYSLVAPEVVKAIVDEAHQLGMTVTGHVPNGMTSQSVVELGFDSIAHMQLRGQAGSEESKAQIAFFKSHGTVMDPTSSWNELGGHPSAAPLDSFLPGVSRLPLPLKRMFDSMSAGNSDVQAWRARLIDSGRLLKSAVDAGLLVVAGTDKGVPGFSLQRELELYVDAGMTPLEALQTATIMPARAMKLDKELGTIEIGKRADLVVCNSDPLARMSNIRDTRWVITNGKMYATAALWRVAGFGF